MRTTRLAVLAVLAAAALPTPAASAKVDPWGRLCAVHKVDSTADGMLATGIHAGPVLFDDGGTIERPHTGAVSCTLQVDAATHDGPDAAVVTGPESTGAAWVNGTASVAAPAGSTIHLCTSVRLSDGTVLYNHRPPGYSITVSWLTDPAAAVCGVASNLLSGVATECNDGIDNDRSGAADYPLDHGCASSADPDEAAPTPPCATGPVRLCAVPGAGAAELTAYLPEAAPETVDGHLDVYRFTLPNGGTVDLPCPVLGQGPDTGSACATAGGTWQRRLVTLASVPTTRESAVPLGTVRVCDASLVATVAEVGLSSFPAHVLC